MREQPLMLAMWLVIAPLMLSTLGYWPGRLGVGHDLPPAVVRDWRRWCLMPEYLFDDPTIDARGYAAYRERVLAYSRPPMQAHGASVISAFFAIQPVRFGAGWQTGSMRQLPHGRALAESRR